MPDSPEHEQTEFDLFIDTPSTPKESQNKPSEAPTVSHAARHFLDWDRSLLDTVVHYLLTRSDIGPVLDLSDHLVVVPTRHAGRRLRESLALHAAKRQAAVFPPLVVTQDFLVSPERVPSGDPVADRPATRLIWSALLLTLDLRQFRRVFPVDPIERDLSWAMETADELLDVRHLLNESGLTFAAAADPLQEQDMEPSRWQELAALEALAIQRTQDLNLRDEILTCLDAATSGTLPPEVKTVLVAATPDLHPIAAATLDRLASELTVDVLVHAPESLSHRFDFWGRPIASQWLEAEINIPDATHTIRDAATPTLQAELAATLLGNREDPAAFVAIGVPDPEVVAPFEQAARQRGWSTYDPAGRPVSHHGIYYLLDQTASLLSTRSFEAVSRLLQCPDFTRALIDQLSTGEQSPHSVTGFLAQIDQLRELCLPNRLDDALSGAKRNFGKHPELAAGLQWIHDWLQRFRKEDFGDTLITYLSEVFAGRTFSPQETAHGAVSEVASAILEAEAAFEATQAAFGRRLDPSERFHLLLELIRERHLYDERKPNHIDLQGWLELLWEDAPHLIVTGLNDHVVPEAIIGHAFLPDSARRVLGIPNNDDRFARDAYLLTSLIESRSSAGRIDLIFGRQNDSGDPLRPSRLLFQCSDRELPERTLQFFSGESPSVQPLPWTLPWQLKPQPLPDENKIFQRLSVTQFRSYLTCPFRFYLQHGLRMEEVDPEKAEMDARDFGNLLHYAVEEFAKEPEAGSSTDPAVIRASLEAHIDTFLYRRYGSQLSTPVLIQREAGRKRLGWWAEIEAQERADGWRIREIETDISPEENTFTIGGLPISGRIDRVEEHEDGRLRVFDFKTHAIYDATKYRNKTVSEYHITPIKRTEDPESFPEWARIENHDNKASRWTDLQIPLYILALSQQFPDREIDAGHIALGPTESEVVIDVWGDLDSKLLASAKTCAEGVIAAVQSQTFWPPAERLPWTDAFEELLFGEAEESVNSLGVTGNKP